MRPDDVKNSFILPTSTESLTPINSQEEVYKSALEIILALCKNYSVSLMDIQTVCETVLRKEKE